MQLLLHVAAILLLVLLHLYAPVNGLPQGRGIGQTHGVWQLYIREIVPKMWNSVGLPVPLTLRLNINRRIRHYKLTTTPAFLTAAGKLSIPDPMVAFTMRINVSNSLQRITLNIIRQSILKNIYL